MTMTRNNHHECNCTDPGCPVHPGKTECDGSLSVTLYRVDMEDRTGTDMCLGCSEDALESGLFTTGEGEEEGEGEDAPHAPHACDDYEGHVKPWANCWNCGFSYSEHEESKEEEEEGDQEEDATNDSGTMHVVVYSPSSDEIYLSRQLAPDEVMDERVFADEVAAEMGLEIEEPNGYIPNCSGDVRVEFRPDPDNPVHIWSGESFHFKREE